MNYKILCVDDEQIILDALDRLFRHVGYQYVLTAHSGELGLGILENNQDTDVIIADEKMGNGISGSQFLNSMFLWVDGVSRAADLGPGLFPVRDSRVVRFSLAFLGVSL